MSMKKNKKNQMSSLDRNILIDYLNHYLEKNGSNFRVDTIILSENAELSMEQPVLKGNFENLKNSGHIDEIVFDSFAQKGVAESNDETFTFSLCDPATRPNCEKDRGSGYQSVCVVNRGSAPHWKCIKIRGK